MSFGAPFLLDVEGSPRNAACRRARQSPSFLTPMLAPRRVIMDAVISDCAGNGRIPACSPWQLGPVKAGKQEPGQHAPRQLPVGVWRCQFRPYPIRSDRALSCWTIWGSRHPSSLGRWPRDGVESPHAPSPLSTTIAASSLSRGGAAQANPREGRCTPACVLAPGIGEGWPGEGAELATQAPVVPWWMRSGTLAVDNTHP